MGFLLTIRQIVEKISMSISDSPIPFAVGIDANNVGPSVVSGHVYIHGDFDAVKRSSFPSGMLDTLRTSTDKNDGTVALVKSGIEKMKTTPAGEYLTSALNDFDPEQHESLAAVSDGANKLLMLVSLVERILEKGHTGRI